MNYILKLYFSIFLSTLTLFHMQCIFSLAKQINYCSHEYSLHTKFKQTVSMVARRIPNDKTERVIERDISGNIFSTSISIIPKYHSCFHRNIAGASCDHFIALAFYRRSAS